MKLPVVGNVSLTTGVAVGVGSLVLAPIVIPMLGALVKPVAKGAIKAGMMVYHRGQIMAAETKESWDDLTAEVKAELAQEAMVEAAEEAKPAPAAKKKSS